MNASDSAPEAREPEQIISADGGPLSICVACRERIAIPNQHYCTECIEPGPR